MKTSMLSGRYLLKDTASDDLVRAIRGTLSGEFHLDPLVAGPYVKHVSNQKNQPASPPIPSDLSQRDLELLKCLAHGLSNRDIGEKLHLSEGTVKNYITKLFKKIGVKDRTQAVLKAVSYGLAEDDSGQAE